MIDGWGISFEIAVMWMTLDFTDDQSILVQVIAWCRQATSHYLSQCWPRSLSSYGVTRPQWVESFHTKWFFPASSTAQPVPIIKGRPATKGVYCIPATNNIIGIYASIPVYQIIVNRIYSELPEYQTCLPKCMHHLNTILVSMVTTGTNLSS